MKQIISHDSEMPAHGQQVITACALIHHDFDGVMKVFLPKRADTKKFMPGYFELPGGHINWGEDIVEGVKREVMEEHGMHINVGDPFAVFTYTNDIKGSHSVEIDYFATFADPIDEIKIHPDDHSEFRWVSLQELEILNSISPEEKRSVVKGLTILNGGKVALG